MCHCSPAPPDCPPDVLINAVCAWGGLGELLALTVVTVVSFMILHYIDTHGKR